MRPRSHEPWPELAVDGLAERTHAALVKEMLGNSLIGPISRDGMAIEARERPVGKEKDVVETASSLPLGAEWMPTEPLPAVPEEVTPIQARRGRPRKGGMRSPKVTKIQ